MPEEKKIKRKTITTAFSLMPRHAEIIEHFIDDKKTFTSASDVVRQALEFFHDKTYPVYIFHLNPAAKDKKEIQDQREALISMPDETFALETIKGKVVIDSAGKPFVLIHQQGNSLNLIPLEDIKEWAAQHGPELNFHLDKLISKSIDDITSNPAIKQAFEQQFGIVL